MTHKKIGRALSILVGICTMVSGMSAFAADSSPIEAKLEKIDLSGTATIVGSINEKNEGENVTLTVYIEGNDYNGLLEADNQVGYVSAFTDTYTDANGEFELKFQINGEQKSGFYTARIGADCAEMPTEITFLYSNIANRKSAIELLNTKKTAAEVYEYVFGSDGKWADLGFYSELQNTLDKNKLAALIAERLNTSGAFNADKGDEVTAEYLYLEVIDALNENKLDNVADYKDRLRLDDSKILNWFEKSYVTSSVQEDITKRLTGRSFKNADEFEDAFIEAVVLETVEHNDGPGTIRDILTDYASEIDADIASATIADFRKLTGEYASYSELEDKLDNILGGTGGAAGNTRPGGGSGSTGSSGGSGGISGVGGAVIEQGVDKAPEAMIPQPEGFADLSEAEWAREAVETLAEMGIINGRSESVFAPNDNITREEFVKIIVGAFSIAKAEENAGFADVADGEWYEVYVDSAYKAGIVKGMSETIFGVGEKISRQDMAVMVHNAARVSGIELAAVKEAIEFSDADRIAEYAKEAVGVLQTAGVISGIGDNMFAPEGNATRAEAAKMIYEIIVLR